MEVISSIYNSGYNIKKFYLGSRELNLAYLGNQVIYDEVIGDNDLNYILYEFYGSDTLPNTVEAPVKSAILKGKTDENLQSVKMPVLTTTNQDNILGKCSITVRGAYGGYIKKLTDTTGEFKVTHSSQDISIGFNGVNTIIGRDKWCYVTIRFGEDMSNVNFNVARGWTLLKDNRTLVFKGLTYAGGNISGFTLKESSGLVLNQLYTFEVIAIIPISSTWTFDDYEPYKTNILTVNEDVTLRSNGDVYDELNLLTGRLTQRIDENNEVLAQAVVKTVDLTIVDQDGKIINKLNSFNGATHVSTEVAENSAYPMVSLEVASELQAAMSKVTEDIELIKPVQNDIETTIDTQSNDIDSLLLATTELFEMIL